MKIKYHKNFEKKLKKLSLNSQDRVFESIRKFYKDPFDKNLRNHPLKGLMKDKRTFSVSSDMRIIFEEYDNYLLVIMLDLGSHSQVYK